MTTLYMVSGSDGVEGRCDASCYNAVGPDCRCCCHGANHGIGLDKAVENTRAWADSLLDLAGTHPDLKARILGQSSEQSRLPI